MDQIGPWGLWHSKLFGNVNNDLFNVNINTSGQKRKYRVLFHNMFTENRISLDRSTVVPYNL